MVEICCDCCETTVKYFAVAELAGLNLFLGCGINVKDGFLVANSRARLKDISITGWVARVSARVYTNTAKSRAASGLSFRRE